MEAGVADEVLPHGGGDGGNIADMLHHGGKSDGHDREDGRGDEAVVGVLKDGEHRALPVNGKSEPGSLRHGGEVHLPHQGGRKVGPDDPQDDGDDLHHPFSPDIADDDNGDGDDGDEPVAGAVVNGGLGKIQADSDNDGARYDGGKIAHDLAGAEKLDQKRQHQVQDAGKEDSQAGVGQKLCLAVWRDGPVGRQVGEGGA